MADYCWVYGVIHFTSPAGRLPVHRDQLRAQRSVTSMGKLYFFTIKSHLSNRTGLCSASYVSCKRGTARICCCAPCCGPVLLRHRPCSSRSISPTRRAHSSKPAARFCSGGIGQTDGRRTVKQTLLRILRGQSQ